MSQLIHDRMQYSQIREQDSGSSTIMTTWPTREVLWKFNLLLRLIQIHKKIVMSANLDWHYFVTLWTTLISHMSARHHVQGWLVLSIYKKKTKTVMFFFFINWVFSNKCRCFLAYISAMMAKAMCCQKAKKHSSEDKWQIHTEVTIWELTWWALLG